MTTTVLAKRSVGTDIINYDAIVIGAGFGGIYMLKKLRDELGLKVRAFDKAGGIGGTWFWNRYPGALSDSESFVYCFSWDRELCQEWDITTRYLTQPQILSYLNHAVDRHDLRRDIQLETAITSAAFDEQSSRWLVTTDDGHQYSAKYLVTALGLLSATNVPKINGLDQFKGHMYHTANWPADAVLEGKRVGVIGTGSTGCQVITAIAPTMGHLTVFQRSAQYTVPVGNGPVSREYVDDIKRNYDAIWKEVRSSRLAFGFQESDIPTMSVDAAERKSIFQRAWDGGGGFRYMFQTFNDIATSEDANLAAQDFVREKIAANLKRCLLELGGKAPFIVLDDADLDGAVHAAVFGAFLYQGQICMSTERFVVDEAVADVFVAKFAQRIRGLEQGNPVTNPASVVGPMISQGSVQRINQLLDDAIGKGATLVVGGLADQAQMAPTLVDRVSSAMDIYDEETFGPVTTVVRVKGAEQALEVANDTAFGLSSAIFSRNVSLALDLASRLDAGCVHINGATVQNEPQAPYGGMKNSGYGRFDGSAVIEEFTEVKWVTVEPSDQPYPF